MIRVSLAALQEIEKGYNPDFRVTVYFQQPETYTGGDLLESVGSIRTAMSREGSYEIANATVTLKDEFRYFSKKFGKELPVKKRVDISLLIEGETIKIFSGIVGSWSKGEARVSLQLQASLLDTLKLRRTSVYRNPKDISILNIVIGDHSGLTIPTTQIDKDGLIYHVSDRPMQVITGVQVEGEPVTHGYKAMPSYQDETGQAVAVVIFDNPQYDKKVTVTGKGAMKLETGELIENPADLISFVMLDIQGYAPAAIDSAELARFYAECLKAGVKLACVLQAADPLKNIFDEIARNIHSRWLLSDGKSVMRLRSRAADNPVRYKFTEIDSPEVTSEEIVNEIAVNFAYDWGSGKYTKSLTKHNPISKVLYAETFREMLDLRMINATRQAEEIVDARLRTYSIPQLLTKFRHNVRSLYLEPGDLVTVTHASGIGENGFEAAEAEIVSKELLGVSIGYNVAMAPSTDLFSSELINLSSVAAEGKEGFSVSYVNGVATITIYADIEGNPPVEGAEVTIAGQKLVTDRQGQARFNLQPGRYTAQVHASGYEDSEIVFTV